MYQNLLQNKKFLHSKSKNFVLGHQFRQAKHFADTAAQAELDYARQQIQAQKEQNPALIRKLGLESQSGGEQQYERYIDPDQDTPKLSELEAKSLAHSKGAKKRKSSPAKAVPKGKGNVAPSKPTHIKVVGESAGGQGSVKTSGFPRSPSTSSTSSAGSGKSGKPPRRPGEALRYFGN